MMLRLDGMRSYLALIAVITACHVTDAQMLLPPFAVGGAMGCVVTENQLYSHGNYIRDLNSSEMSQVQKYKEKMAVFQKKFNEAMNDALQTSQNGTITGLPHRPAVPNFCFGKDTLLYVLSGCTVQNYKLYIGLKFVRELDAEERMELDKFANQLGAIPRLLEQDANTASKTTTSATTIKPPALPPSLDFCIEF